MYKTGTKTITIDGKEHVFHFGMNAQALCEQTLGGNMDVGFMTWARCLIWAALVVVKSNDMPKGFSLEDMGELIDKMSEDDFHELMEEATSAMGKMADLTRKVMGKEAVNKVMQLMAASQVQ